MNAAMKSLNEQIEEVMASTKSQRAKRDELVKIGLCQRDIDMLFFADRIAKKHGKKLSQLITGYTFGVEIECYNAPRTRLLAAANRQGLAMRSESYNHDDNRHYYKLVQDGSIRGTDPVECVSPILQGNNSGFDSLKACCDALNEIGAMVNKSTGLHIHVGGNITEQQYCNTFVNYYYLERLVDTFMAPSRKDAYYASSMHGNLHGRYFNYHMLLAANTFEQVANAFRNDRYFKINCQSWLRHHTIEFRQHGGTTNYEKIRMWALFCLKLVAWSADNRLSADIHTIDEIPFLDETEKTYFKQRSSELQRVAA